MHVPLLDIASQYQSIKPEIDKAVARVLAKGNYVAGEEVSLFEQEWAAYCGKNYCVGVSSCTDAIYLALRAIRELAAEEGRELTKALTTPLTFWGTYEAIHRAGLKANFCDVDDELGIMKPAFQPDNETIIVPVNLYGASSEDRPEDRRSDYWLNPVVLDNAQGHGTEAYGHVTCYSFYPSKNLGAAGQGGAIVTDSKQTADLVRCMANHGESKTRFLHKHVAGNYRLDELQAAILRAKLPHLDAWNKRRLEIARMYDKGLTLASCLEKGFKLPPVNHESVWHIYNVRVDDPEGLAIRLNGLGIQTAHRYPFLITEMIKDCDKYSGKFPVATEWSRTNISLPIDPMMTDEQVNYVIKAIESYSPNMIYV